MNKTKEEMKETAINPKIAETNIIKEAAEIIYKTLNRGQEQNSTSIINAIEQRINDCFISLTDQIKSMEEENGKEIKNKLIAFKDWYDSLQPHQKTSVWSDDGQSNGLVTMNSERLVTRYLEKHK